MHELDIHFDKGSVWLVGAGPGDPGLLTVLASEAIKNADIIFYDALINNDILLLSKPNAELRYVGKRASKHSISQIEISNNLIAESKKNKRVLRLKGGDPFIFGRGGEEALALKLSQVPFRVVPGITAGIAGLSYAGIPATHRDFNTSITFISGYGAGGEKPNTLDWKSFTKTSQLIVIYMGFKRICWICKQLILRGRNKNDQIAIISNATTAKQRIFIGALKDYAEEARVVEKIQSPSLLVIGKNVLLSPILSWFKKEKANNISFIKNENSKEYKYEL